MIFFKPALCFRLGRRIQIKIFFIVISVLNQLRTHPVASLEMAPMSHRWDVGRVNINLHSLTFIIKPNYTQPSQFRSLTHLEV